MAARNLDDNAATATLIFKPVMPSSPAKEGSGVGMGKGE